MGGGYRRCGRPGSDAPQAPTGTGSPSGNVVEMTVPGPGSAAACAGSPPCAGQYGWNVQKSHRRPGLGRKSSRAHAPAIADHSAVVRIVTPRTDCSDGTAMIA